jgi:hypothetical protein
VSPFLPGDQGRKRERESEGYLDTKVDAEADERGVDLVLL